MQPNQLFVDMDKEVVFAPINGQPVPLSIHTIKNVTQPDPDNHCHYLRINFFTAGLVSRSLGYGEGGFGRSLGGVARSVHPGSVCALVTTVKGVDRWGSRWKPCARRRKRSTSVGVSFRSLWPLFFKAPFPSCRADLIPFLPFCFSLLKCCAL